MPLAGVQMILDIPRFKCWVQQAYLSNNEQNGFVEGYCIAVTLIENRPLLFTVHTIGGAIYSRLPIYAVNHEPMLAEHPLRPDTWGAISSNGQVIAHQYLKDYRTVVTIDGEKFEGIYKFTIDYFDGGFAEDPEQHKTSNIIFLENGKIAAVPNNQCLFLDSHFTGPDDTKYKRNTTYFMLP